MQTFTVGEVKVTRVVEWKGVLFTRAGVLAESDRAEWIANSDWLEPAFWNAQTDEITVAIQTFVVQSNGTTILIDTGIGNSKIRPDVPAFNQLQTDFLTRLAAAGIVPSDVDFVICTHLHPDHVGWNTSLIEGSWIPTFPNAKYLISRTEFDFWNPINGFAQNGPHAEDHIRVFDDSVQPVADAGQIQLWENEFRIDDNVRLSTVAGHTPGSAIVTVTSKNETAHFVGDLVGTPMMICHPDLYAHNGDRTVDHDPALVTVARNRILGLAADTGDTVIPAHFDCNGVTITRSENGFQISLVTNETKEPVAK